MEEIQEHLRTGRKFLSGSIKYLLDNPEPFTQPVAQPQYVTAPQHSQAPLGQPIMYPQIHPSQPVIYPQLPSSIPGTPSAHITPTIQSQPGYSSIQNHSSQPAGHPQSPLYGPQPHTPTPNRPQYGHPLAQTGPQYGQPVAQNNTPFVYPGPQKWTAAY